MNKNKTYKPRIILWDIETSLLEVSTFTLYPKYISHEAIIHDWYMISACWKELGKRKIHSVSLLDDTNRFSKDFRDDYHVVKVLRDMLEDVDILIGHNGDAFDLKKFNARLIYHKLKPLNKLVTIDTLKQARKIAKFTSNRLDALGKYFGVGGKSDHPSGLWEGARVGDKKAIKDMVKYNKRDVDLLEEVYLRLRPYMSSHPNIADPNTINCPKCDSSHIHKHKVRASARGIRRQQYQCGECFGYFTDRHAEKDKPLSQ